jgi:hypothetical protein
MSTSGAEASPETRGPPEKAQLVRPRPPPPLAPLRTGYPLPGDRTQGGQLSRREAVRDTPSLAPHHSPRSRRPTAVHNLRLPRVHERTLAGHHTFVGSEPISQDSTGHPTLLSPFLACLDGEPTPKADLVSAGRRLARGLVLRGRSVIICEDGPWTGVWDLDRLTDEEAVAWGLCVATKVRRLGTRP